MSTAATSISSPLRGPSGHACFPLDPQAISPASTGWRRRVLLDFARSQSPHQRSSPPLFHGQIKHNAALFPYSAVARLLSLSSVQSFFLPCPPSALPPSQPATRQRKQIPSPPAKLASRLQSPRPSELKVANARSDVMLPNAKPLEGLHVLEIGAYLAAPLTCTHLADLGAAVTSILRPHHARGAATEAGWRPETAKALRKGKRTLTLDLKKEEGRVQLQEMIRSADVLVVGFSTAAMAR
eukprot:scaffold116292_cov29-Tisochrysis_lutea.AAC.2